MKILIALMLHASLLIAADPIAISLPGKEASFTLAQLKAKLPVVSITIEDPVYKTRKTFDGFRLTELLKLAGWKAGTSGDELVFTAKDGYAPNTSFENLGAHAAVLAFREHGKADFQFGKVAQGKALVTPAPYYLVWEDGAKLGESVPWPYQLAKIEVVNFAQKYAKLYPSRAATDSSVMQGFVLFKNQCLRCHSVNLQGGDVGPELNAPKNITEYWAADTLKLFIKDATSFRYKSKMPPFPHLTDAQVKQITDYLGYMKGFKIPPG